jgi:DNA helicase-2/ATP-dependent DNA helicase PcrA
VRSRFLDEIPAKLTDERSPEGTRGRGRSGLLAETTWASADSGGGKITAYASGGGPGRQPGGGSAWRSVAGPSAALDFRIGDDVVHAAFGDGVVTGTDPAGGVIVVRFASGSEKHLLAELAPVSRR